MGRNLMRVCIHFVWATWDRLPLATDDVERQLHRYMVQVCEEDGCDVLAVGGMSDHVHLLVRLSNTICLADLMRHVKGGSSRFVSKTLKPDEWFAWQGSYGATAVSPRDRDKLIAYIANQKRHHAEGRLWPAIEETQDDS